MPLIEEDWRTSRRLGLEGCLYLESDGIDRVKGPPSKSSFEVLETSALWVSAAGKWVFHIKVVASSLFGVFGVSALWVSLAGRGS